MVAAAHGGYGRVMTETPEPLTEPDNVPEPDEAPAPPPLEPSVTNPDADGVETVPS
jgi:hypothetical protein